MPKSVQPAARRAIFEITNAENKDAAKRAVKAFADDFGAKWPKAVAKITDDEDALLTFYDFPAEHWIHLRTIRIVIVIYKNQFAGSAMTQREPLPASGTFMGNRLPCRALNNLYASRFDSLP
jgi:transposase-like protein